MASLGYWMGAPYAGKGLMGEAVRLVMSRSRRRACRLRRIEAACVPENQASLRLLEKAGFVREGYAREYLAINGVWRDHLLFAKLTSSANESDANNQSGPSSLASPFASPLAAPPGSGYQTGGPDAVAPDRKCRLLKRILLFLAVLTAWLAAILRPMPSALDAVRVRPEQTAVNLLPAIERYQSQGDRITISTAPGADGIVRRIEVRANDVNTRPDWIAFALSNDTDEQIDRLLVAPHYRFVGSGVIWPDLGSARIRAVTASQGLRPEREEYAGVDAFLITLDPGTTVTFVAELGANTLPQLELWEVDAYTERVNSLTLYRGVVVGIAALLALFLSIVFVVKGAVIFPGGGSARLGRPGLSRDRFRLHGQAFRHHVGG